MDVRTLCLCVLSMGDASGYEIKKCLEGPFKHFFTASFGSIYPALGKLQTEGLVTCNLETQDSRPDKKVYRLTADGRLALLAEMAKTPAPDRLKSEFLVAMTFAELLPARHVSDVIDARIEQHRQAIEELEQIDAGALQPGRQFVLGYGLAVYRGRLKYLEENRHLVEGEALMAQLDDGPSAADTAAAPLTAPLP